MLDPAAGCTGISIIWSANCGFTTYFYYFVSRRLSLYKAENDKLIFTSLLVSLLYATTLWIYYAIVEDILTTIAHIAAVALGYFISFLLIHATSLLPNRSVEYAAVETS